MAVSQMPLEVILTLPCFDTFSFSVPCLYYLIDFSNAAVCLKAQNWNNFIPTTPFKVLGPGLASLSPSVLILFSII